MKVLKKFGRAGVLAAAVLACSGAAWAQAKVTTIQMTSTWPAGINLIDADKHFVDTVNAIGEGSIRIKFMPGETLVPSTQVFDAVRSGSLDASADWAGYWAGTDSAFALIGSFPMLFNASDYILWAKNWGGQELLNETYGKYGMVYLLHGVITSESGIRGNKPIKSVADLKGMRIRMSGQPQGEILKHFGASQVLVPGSEVYQALERGVFDAAEFSTPSTDLGMGLQEVSKFNLAPGWHQPGSATGVMINKKVWDKLSDAQRTILRVAADATLTWSLAHFEKGSAEATKAFAKAGTTVYNLSADDMGKMQRVANDILVKQSCANPLFAKIAASQLHYLADYSDWRKMQGEFALGRNIDPFPDLKAIETCAK